LKSTQNTEVSRGLMGSARVGRLRQCTDLLFSVFWASGRHCIDSLDVCTTKSELQPLRY